MPPKPKEPPSNACGFCGSEEENEEVYGKMLRKSGITIHYFCMLFSSGLWQRGKRDQDGILGFMPVDIRREQKRGQRLTCQYCKKKGATIGCCVPACRKTFHFRCGIEAGGLCQFYQEFRSYCADHRPRQGTPTSSSDRLAFYGTAKSTCSICMLAVEARSSNDTLRSPCCRNAWFHRNCLQRYAVTAGAYFFKCPLCNNKDLFEAEMLEFGIYIPEQDAAWEQEPNAFQELLERYNRCDADKCLCPQGPEHNGTAGGRWQIILCGWCGSSGSHKGCDSFTKIGKDSVCNECAAISPVVEEDRKTHKKEKKRGSSGNFPHASLNEEELRRQLEQRRSSSLRAMRAARRQHSTSPSSEGQQQPSTSSGRKTRLEEARVTSPTILEDHRLIASVPVVRIERAESEVEVNVVDVEEGSEMSQDEQSSGDAARLHTLQEWRQIKQVHQTEQVPQKKRVGRPTKKKQSESWGVQGVIDKGPHKVVLVSVQNDSKPDYSSDSSVPSATAALKTGLQHRLQSHDNEADRLNSVQACLEEQKVKVVDSENDRVGHQDPVDSSRVENATDAVSSHPHIRRRPLRARQLFSESVMQYSSDDNNNFSGNGSSGEGKCHSPVPGPSKVSPKLTRLRQSKLNCLRQIKRQVNPSSSSEETDSEPNKSRLNTKRRKMTRSVSFLMSAGRKGRECHARSTDSSTSTESMATKVRYQRRHTPPSTFVHSSAGYDDDDNDAWFDKSKSSSGLSTVVQGLGNQAVSVTTSVDPDGESDHSSAILEILNIKTDPTTEPRFKSTSPVVKTEDNTQPVELMSSEEECNIVLAPQITNGAVQVLRAEEHLLETPLGLVSELSTQPEPLRIVSVSSAFTSNQTRFEDQPPVPASFAQFQIPKPQAATARSVPPLQSAPPHLVLAAASQSHQVTGPHFVVHSHNHPLTMSDRYHHLAGTIQPSTLNVPVSQVVLPHAQQIAVNQARPAQIRPVPVVPALGVTMNQAHQRHASPSQVQYVHVPVTQVQHTPMTQAQTLHLPMNQAHCMPVSQAQYVTLARNAEMQFPPVIAPSRTQCIPVSQVNPVSQTQVQGMPPMQAQRVAITQAQHMIQTNIQGAPVTPVNQPAQATYQTPQIPGFMNPTSARPIQCQLVPSSQTSLQHVGHSQYRHLRNALSTRIRSATLPNRVSSPHPPGQVHPMASVAGLAQSTVSAITESQQLLLVSQSSFTATSGTSQQAQTTAAVTSTCGTSSYSNADSAHSDYEIVDVDKVPPVPSPQERSLTPVMVPGSAISLLPMLKSRDFASFDDLSIIAESHSQSSAPTPQASSHYESSHFQAPLHDSSLVTSLQSVSTSAGAGITSQQASASVSDVGQYHTQSGVQKATTLAENKNAGPKPIQSGFTSTNEAVTSAVTPSEKLTCQSRRLNKPLSSSASPGQPAEQQTRISASSTEILQTKCQPEGEGSLPVSRGKVWLSPNPIPLPLKSGTVFVLLSDSEGSDVEVVNVERKSAPVRGADECSGTNYNKNVAGQTDLNPTQSTNSSSFSCPSSHSTLPRTSSSVSPSVPLPVLPAPVLTPSLSTGMRHRLRPGTGRPPCPIHGYNRLVQHPRASVPAHRNDDGSLTIDLTDEPPAKKAQTGEFSSDSDVEIIS